MNNVCYYVKMVGHLVVKLHEVKMLEVTWI